MLNEMVFDADEVPAADRFDRWRELVSSTYAPVEIDSEYRNDFRASQRVVPLGRVAVWSATFPPTRFRRTPALIRRSDPETVYVSVPMSAPVSVDRDGRQTGYTPYSLCVVDSSLPFTAAAGDGLAAHQGIGVEVPKSLLPMPWETARRVTDLRLSGREGGFGGLLTRFLTQLIADTGCYRPSDAPRLATLAVDLVSSLFAHSLDADGALPPETRERALLARVRSFIDRQLPDPSLTPRAVAAAHHISVSYLHRLFKAEGTTVAAWTRQRRLERARRYLVDPSLLTTPVHEIAARCGFTHHATFTRHFHAAYGLPPREYRSQALVGAGQTG